MPVLHEAAQTYALLKDKATRLRINSIRATTEAASGHPTSCASAADIVATLFFEIMRRDERGYVDRFILSKGHAAPLLYAAWAEAGALKEDDLLHLRDISSDLEGHPTPRLPFVDVATGSLGQGLAAGVGMALDAKHIAKTDRRVYVLMGDGESAEGSVWEAAASGSHYRLNNLCATIDINRLGQSEPTMPEYDIDAYESRWRGFGWEVFAVDGHDFSQLVDAYRRAAAVRDRPSVILAKTRKGEGIPGVAGREGHHGKALSREEMTAAIDYLKQRLNGKPAPWQPIRFPARQNPKRLRFEEDPPYQQDTKPIATRRAFGDALAAMAKANPEIVVLDADVKNSTYTELAQKVAPERFFQFYIAEQCAVGAAMGLSTCGRVPFFATFACFLTRAYDFVRMAAIGGNNIKLVGTHAGISIGEDGPSQMGLEDLAMMCAQPNITVLYPSDAVSTWRATGLMAETNGPAYMRATRMATPILYAASELFEIGRCKVVRQSGRDHVTVVAAGVTLFEALKACDQLSKEGVSLRVIDLFSLQPIDRAGLSEAVRQTQNRLVVVEDHYLRGGIGEAVCSVLAEEGLAVKARLLTVREIPRSGQPEELLDRFGISARTIVEAVRSLL
jgi:transketolase